MSLRMLIAAVLTGAVLLTPTSAEPAAFWNAIGVAQALKCLKNATVNPLGNHPGLECPPPPKPIADPANLESDNPAIKLAAEIKQQEDLKRQKIKAIKYLARVGCGCYPGVAEAFAAATEDCTEDVRLAAAEAIKDASGEVCSCCNQDGCCSEDLLKKLAERAYGRDETGCFIEPSDRVREALREALDGCCRGLPPMYEPEEEPAEEPEPIPDPEPAPDEEDTEEAPLDEESEFDGSEGFENDQESEGTQQSEVVLLREQLGSLTAPLNTRATKWVTGRIEQVDPTNSRVIIQHEGKGESLRGAKAEVYHRFLLRNEKVGDLRVLAASEGRLVATAPVPVKYLRVGSTVRVQVAIPEGAGETPPMPVAAPGEMLAETPPPTSPLASGTQREALLASEPKRVAIRDSQLEPARSATVAAPEPEPFEIRRLPDPTNYRFVSDAAATEERSPIVAAAPPRRLPGTTGVRSVAYDDSVMKQDADRLSGIFDSRSWSSATSLVVIQDSAEAAAEPRDDQSGPQQDTRAGGEISTEAPAEARSEQVLLHRAESLSRYFRRDAGAVGVLR